MFLRKKKDIKFQPKLSYSQCGEDLIVKFIFDTIGIKQPSYIDIGAHHPYFLNNTAIFYLQGSRGINIEPDPDLFKLFEEHRKEDVNLNCGAGAKNGELTFHVMDISTMNTFSETEPARLAETSEFKIVKKIPVKVLSLNEIIEKYFNSRFPDFLTIDVEGMDEVILDTINFERAKPTVICVETITYSARGEGVKNYAMARMLETKGYMAYADTHINTIFVLKDKWLRK